MQRAVMKNGDIVHLESYDWGAYRTPAQLSLVIRELQDHLDASRNAYPGQKIIVNFNSAFGSVPDRVQQALKTAGAEIQSWP
jgi:hypothetical protein